MFSVLCLVFSVLCLFIINSPQFTDHSQQTENKCYCSLIHWFPDSSGFIVTLSVVEGHCSLSVSGHHFLKVFPSFTNEFNYLLRRHVCDF